jgi:hypothetical protein
MATTVLSAPSALSTPFTFSTKVRTANFWTSTGIIALAFLWGGLAWLAGVEETLRGMAELGYPPYFVTILGVWKTLGAIALVTAIAAAEGMGVRDLTGARKF